MRNFLNACVQRPRAGGLLAGSCLILAVTLLLLNGCGVNHGVSRQKETQPPPWPYPKSSSGVRVSSNVQMRTLIAKNVPGTGLIELLERVQPIEVKIGKDVWFPQAAYMYSLRWTPPRQSAREYFISGPADHWSGRVELRATEDYRGIWIVEPDEVGDFDRKAEGPTMGLVMCSLDTVTGEFLDLNGVAVNPKLPLEKQEAGATEQKEYPNWATLHGGILLTTFQR